MHEYSGASAIKNSGLFHKYVPEHKITYIPSRGHTVFAERRIRTFRDMLDKRIKPNQQWTDLIYPILLTSNKRFVHSATEYTPDDAKQPFNELMTYTHRKLKAKHNRRIFISISATM